MRKRIEKESNALQESCCNYRITPLLIIKYSDLGEWMKHNLAATRFSMQTPQGKDHVRVFLYLHSSQHPLEFLGTSIIRMLLLLVRLLL